MAKQRFTLTEIENAIRKSNGFLGTASKSLGCSLRTVQNYVSRYPSLQELKDELRYQCDDIVENQLMKGITEGNTALIIFYAKTRLGYRGYGQDNTTTPVAGTENLTIPKSEKAIKLGVEYLRELQSERN